MRAIHDVEERQQYHSCCVVYLTEMRLGILESVSILAVVFPHSPDTFIRIEPQARHFAEVWILRVQTHSTRSASSNGRGCGFVPRSTRRRPATRSCSTTRRRTVSM